MLKVIMKNICTLFGLGQVSRMPGTLGSIAGIFLGVFFLFFLPKQIIYIIFIVSLLISFYAIKVYQKDVGKSDRSEIIIDEVLGQFLVLIFLDLNFLNILFAFVLFRFFDILKIFPANIVDKNYSNHYGVVLDDIIAALQSLIVIFIFKSGYGKFF